MRNKQPGPLARPNAPTKKTQVFLKTTHTRHKRHTLLMTSVVFVNFLAWCLKLDMLADRDGKMLLQSSEEELKSHTRRFGC